MRLYFDIEADALLENVSKIWCICAVDLDSDQEWSWGPEEIDEGLAFLEQADVLVGHWSTNYDFPALKKVCGWDPKKPKRYDTVVLARLAYPNIKRTDGDLVAAGKLDKKLHGRDSLKAWGQRINEHKADYEGGFEAWSEEMQDYCLQDVKTGKALWHFIKVDEMDARSVELETRVFEVCQEMEKAGWPFNEERAQQLYTELVSKKHELEQSLVEKFGSWQAVDKVFIPKRDNKRLGYVQGVEVTKYKTVVFNPGSRQHIEKKLRELGWTPTEYTSSGRAKLDEEILVEIAQDHPEAQLLVDYLLLQKRLGQLADGDAGWLRLVDNHGLIHASYNTMGTVTGRASHFKPNIAQVPSNGALYGEACRDLFTVRTGFKLLGADFEGLELRCLAAYMAHWDKGAYGEIILNGDIHTVNQEAAGLPTRATAKTFIYGFLYGAGDEKIGKIVGKGPQTGKKLKERFLAGIPALGALRKAVAAGAEKGWLKGLDGRHIPVRSKHASLNSLLQSAGAVLCKTWLVDTYDTLRSHGYRWGWHGDFVIVGWVHDELQIAVREGLEDTIGPLVVKCAQEASRNYTFPCRLDSKYVVGSTWAETH